MTAATDVLFGFTNGGFLFLSELVAWTISHGIQARQKGAPFSPVSDLAGIIKEIYTDKKAWGSGLHSSRLKIVCQE
jgi:hypothetical protein